MKISWDEAALAALGDAMEYIAGDSYAAAIRVRTNMDEALCLASRYPLAHPPDRYREDGDVTFRAFEAAQFQDKLPYRAG